MRPIMRTAFVLVACVASAPTAFAQSASVADTLCGLYKQAAAGGKDAIVGFRGAEDGNNKWHLKDVTVEGGDCSVRSNAKKKRETLVCSFQRASAAEANKWVEEMATSARTCLNGLPGFEERASGTQGDDEEGKQGERVGWFRANDAGTLVIGLATVVKDGKAGNRMAIRYTEK